MANESRVGDDVSLQKTKDEICSPAFTKKRINSLMRSLFKMINRVEIRRAVKKLLLIFFSSLCSLSLKAQQPVPVKPRILISTDMGGTDPDDNQSMIHFLMYSNLFETEGLISSPSYGHGNKQDIVEMIDLYGQDLPRLARHAGGYPTPDALHAVCKQGRQGMAPFAGYMTPTEGSDWIIKCAGKKSDRPLWVLVWGGLDDLAQALHDDPAIQHHIKVYWIGGPNKKWSANSYAYIAKNFPDLWFIEDNASYRGFFSDKSAPDSLKDDRYDDNYIKGAGHLGKAFANYYGADIKMGDTPSLLYMMDGDPDNPLKDSWGGSFEKLPYSPRIIFHRSTTTADTVAVYSVVTFRFKGPALHIPPDSACFTLTVAAGAGKQKWPGYYLDSGAYAVRYVPKQAETLSYQITSAIPGFAARNGQLVVKNTWPGKHHASDYNLGNNWYTDRSDPHLFVKKWQGAKTVLSGRKQALLDWAKRWAWLR
jgi:hypothetical protein